MGLPRTVRMEHWHGLKITSKIGWSADVIRLTGHPSHLILTSLTSIYGGSSKSIREQAKDDKWFEIAIEHKILSVPRHQCERVIKNFKRRIDVCIQILEVVGLLFRSTSLHAVTSDHIKHEHLQQQQKQPRIEKNWLTSTWSMAVAVTHWVWCTCSVSFLPLSLIRHRHRHDNPKWFTLKDFWKMCWFLNHSRPHIIIETNTLLYLISVFF